MNTDPAADKAEDFAEHIRTLRVSTRLKRAFTLIERYNMEQQAGLIIQPAALKEAMKGLRARERRAVFKRLSPGLREDFQLTSWLTAFFGPLYYLFTGMWRKGLVYLAGATAIGFLLVGAETLFNTSIPDPLFKGLGIAINLTMARAAFYDRYRSLVRHEIFWW